jgi:hypothetical protein
MPVTLPDIEPKRQIARKLAEALASEIPLAGGPLAALFSVTHPAKAEQLQAAWQADITSAVNNLEATVNQLLPSITISSSASAVGVWISRNSERGRTSSIEFSALIEAFPDASQLEIEDACGELEHLGLLGLSGAIGAKIFLLRPESLLFQVFDPIAFENANPRADAANLARFILTDDRGIRATEMLSHFGWTVRRLNPALAILCAMISDGGQSAEINRDFVTTYLRPLPTDRAALRWFANSVLGAE